MNSIKRALLSVSDKAGIVEFARQLVQRDIEILSTGGTAQLLRDNGIKVTEVSDYTGFPEIMAGRVKTLHPKIHGGILARRGTDEAVMEANDIAPIDLVAVNLYPFAQTVAEPNCDLAKAIENIDIGGPTMVRSAAKNHAAVTIIVDNSDYTQVLKEMQQHDGAVSNATRFRLAAKAFEHTAHYDGLIANHLGSLDIEQPDGPRLAFPRTFNSQMIKTQELRYGENPHQRAAFYVEPKSAQGPEVEACIATANSLQGKELSFNNIADADTALECVKAFTTQQPACVIVKHANPCGVAIAETLLEAYDRAYRTDPTSAFGGIIAFNQDLDAETCQAIIERQFVEVIIAPSINEAALGLLASKPNIRVLSCGTWSAASQAGLDYKRVNGGLLIQDRDTGSVNEKDLKIVTRRAPSTKEMADLLFAWKVAKFVKSNAIVYCQGGMTIGVGAGQMSRIYSARIAAIKAADADLDVKGSVMASDAFFPFRDGLDSAAEVGVTAVIQPGGSMRDQEVIDAADEHDIAMVFTGMRHFRH